mmetsp:Transcript_8120/g.23304  ORF Transcript_8120/g.23304 Transcript_8120/m.23304 type:complete len:91 (+) Transcript_8120:1814-2086(+)
MPSSATEEGTAAPFLLLPSWPPPFPLRLRAQAGEGTGETALPPSPDAHLQFVMKGTCRSEQRDSSELRSSELGQAMGVALPSIWYLLAGG